MVQFTVDQIGLGNMGGSVARHLLEEGFDVVGYDVDAETRSAFTEYGDEAAKTIAAVAADVDFPLHVTATILRVYTAAAAKDTGTRRCPRS